jgi:hypothetical protein
VVTIRFCEQGRAIGSDSDSGFDCRLFFEGDEMVKTIAHDRDYQVYFG